MDPQAGCAGSGRRCFGRGGKRGVCAVAEQDGAGARRVSRDDFVCGGFGRGAGIAGRDAFAGMGEGARATRWAECWMTTSWGPIQRRARRIACGYFPGMARSRTADSPSRELARAIEEIDGRAAIRMMFRVDRYGRGGDHYPFYKAGLPAVRFTEPLEDLRPPAPDAADGKRGGVRRLRKIFELCVHGKCGAGQCGGCCGNWRWLRRRRRTRG